MFVTNKRIKPPKEIIIDTKIVNNKTVDIKVSVVTSFKLLGVTLDNKLIYNKLILITALIFVYTNFLNLNPKLSIWMMKMIMTRKK